MEPVILVVYLVDGNNNYKLNLENQLNIFTDVLKDQF